MTAPNYGRDGLMAIAAFRYCLGRTSYIVGDCAEWLIEQWPSLPPNVRGVIERDLRDAIKRDDEARATGEEYRPLGWDCDRVSWLRVMGAIEAHNVYGNRLARHQVQSELTGLLGHTNKPRKA